MKEYWYCGVSVKKIDKIYSYISDTGEIEKDTFVQVPFGDADTLRFGTVVWCEKYTAGNAPYPVEKTKHIVRIVTPEEFWAHAEEEEHFSQINDDLGYSNYLIENGLYDRLMDWANENRDSQYETIVRQVIKSYELCAANGITEAALNLGTYYYNGIYLEQDYKKAFELYKIAADAGVKEAISNCGYCYYYGRHQQVDYAEAFRYFSLGATLFDDAVSLYKLGDMYLNGYAVEKNEKYAFILYERALNLVTAMDEPDETIADAQLRVGKCLLRGIGTEKNIENAHGLLTIALLNFYKRRKKDPFVGSLIESTKALVDEARLELDKETIR